MKGKLVSILFSLAVLAGCAVTAEKVLWPDQAYPREYFVATYQEDNLLQMVQTRDEYLLWVSRFYYGNSLAPGWLSLTEQVLAKVDAARQDEIRERLYHLGARIGSEWAKPNGMRRLNTRNAAVWRDALIESINQGELDDYMDRVEDDVESLLAGELDKEDIYFERYYVDEFDF